MSSKRPTKRANFRHFPNYVEPTERAAGSQANKDENKRRHIENKRRKAIKLRRLQKASRIANRGRH